MSDAPTYYDIGADEVRPVDQEQLDFFACTEQAYGRLRMGMRALLDATHKMATGQTPLWSPHELILAQVSALERREPSDEERAAQSPVERVRRLLFQHMGIESSAGVPFPEATPCKGVSFRLSDWAADDEQAWPRLLLPAIRLLAFSLAQDRISLLDGHFSVFEDGHHVHVSCATCSPEELAEHIAAAYE